jgi:hypothetical protein
VLQWRLENREPLMPPQDPDPDVQAVADIQFVDCATGEILGHSVPFWPPSRAAYVRKIDGKWCLDGVTPAR